MEFLWYLVIAFSILAYTVLDGFDLGVGILHPFAKGDTQRRIFLNAIGPVWDGNEVWIVIIMGGLFAGFPNAYATVFSGFYILLMFLIAGLMFRAAAIEFRSKMESPIWRKIWDYVFFLASILVAFVLGVVLGNIIQGVPLNETQDFIGTFSDFFRPYSIIIGLTAISLFAMHGAIYLTMKTEGEPHEVVKKWIGGAIVSFVFWYFVATIATILYVPHMTHRLREEPYFLIFPLIAFLAIINVPYQVRKNRFGWAFISSCGAIFFLLSLFSLGTYPIIVRSTIDPLLHSVTVYNAASSTKTLKILLLIVLIGIPLVFAYTIWLYRVFRGKVRLEKTSY